MSANGIIELNVKGRAFLEHVYNRCCVVGEMLVQIGTEH